MIVMGVVELNWHLGLSLTIYDIVATYILYNTKNEAYSLRPCIADQTLVNELLDTNKDMVDTLSSPILSFIRTNGVRPAIGHRIRFCLGL